MWRRMARRISLITIVAASLFIVIAVGAAASGSSVFNVAAEFLGVPVAASSDKSQGNQTTPRNPSGDRQQKAPVGGQDVSGAGPRSVGNGIMVGQSYHKDTSPPLRDMLQMPMSGESNEDYSHEALRNPAIPNNHIDRPDTVVQNTMFPEAMPTPILNFNGVPFPGVVCNCEPPDTNGEVGATQYVQIVNEGYQVFNKDTGASVLGPASIVSIWAGFGGVCQSGGQGDPVVLYDSIANRWLVSQFAGSGGTPTDECIAISQTSDATGSWHRYGFHLGSNFFDYPHLGVWPDGYYMSDNVFNAAGTQRLGPQPFVFDRVAMLAGNPATFITPGITVNAN